MHNLPEFEAREHANVMRYVRQVFGESGDQSNLVDLIGYEDGHYRAIFRPLYFIIQPGKDKPSKSQWNTLKKHMKRLDKRVFIFRQHGETHTKQGPCYYIDFGFFAN